jgi:hypothetical protein
LASHNLSGAMEINVWRRNAAFSVSTGSHA